MSCIYALKLSHNKWYIGKTEKDINRRKYEHEHNIHSNKFVQKYAPIISIEKIRDLNGNSRDGLFEDFEVRFYMKEYSINNVRGGTYTELVLTDDVINQLTEELLNADKCRICGDTDHFMSDCIYNFISKIPVETDCLCENADISLDNLNTEQKTAFDMVSSGVSGCIIGPGGSGKSFLGKVIKKRIWR